MSMNRQTVTAAKAEAQEFINACDATLERLDTEAKNRDDYCDMRATQGYDGPRPGKGPTPADYSYGSKETGTLRRRSMDLTRILAQLRRYSG